MIFLLLKEELIGTHWICPSKISSGEIKIFTQTLLSEQCCERATIVYLYGKIYFLIKPKTAGYNKFCNIHKQTVKAHRSPILYLGFATL